MANPVWAELAAGHSRLMLQERQAMFEEIPVLAGLPLGGTCIIVMRFGTRDHVRSLYQRVLAAGLVVTSLRDTDYGTTEFSARDPDGYVVIAAGRDQV